jgi:hypothetical protein
VWCGGSGGVIVMAVINSTISKDAELGLGVITTNITWVLELKAGLKIHSFFAKYDLTTY